MMYLGIFFAISSVVFHGYIQKRIRYFLNKHSRFNDDRNVKIISFFLLHDKLRENEKQDFKKIMKLIVLELLYFFLVFIFSVIMSLTAQAN